MVSAVVAVVVAAALLLALVAGVQAVRGRTVGTPQLVTVAVLELTLLVQAVVAVVLLARGERAAETGVFLGYVGGSLLVPPGALVLALTERSRWSSVILCVTGLVTAVLVQRMRQTWFGLPAGA